VADDGQYEEGNGTVALATSPETYLGPEKVLGMDFYGLNFPRLNYYTFVTMGTVTH
jgi:hypothetical protein